MDFIVECAWPDDPPPEEHETQPAEPTDSGPSWVLHMDGTSNAQGSGAGLILASPHTFYTEYALRFSFKATNNQAEYEALLTRLWLVEWLGAKHWKVFTNSQLVMGQTTREYEAQDLTLAKYLDKFKSLQTKF